MPYLHQIRQLDKQLNGFMTGHLVILQYQPVLNLSILPATETSFPDKLQTSCISYTMINSRCVVIDRDISSFVLSFETIKILRILISAHGISSQNRKGIVLYYSFMVLSFFDLWCFLQQIPFIAMYRREDCFDLLKEPSDDHEDNERPMIQQYGVRFLACYVDCGPCASNWYLYVLFCNHWWSLVG